MPNFVFVRFFPKAEAGPKVRAILENMVVNTRQEPGCTLYNLYEMTGPDDRQVFCLTEQYLDDDALMAHRAADYYKDYRATIMDLLDAPIEVNIMTPIDAV